MKYDDILQRVFLAYCVTSFAKSPREKEMMKYVKWRLAFDEKWCKRALEVIYNRQTEEEKASNQTRVWNDIGFNKIDAEILSSMARSMNKYNGSLTAKQLDVVKRRIQKYWSQVYSLCDKEKLWKIMQKDARWNNP